MAGSSVGVGLEVLSFGHLDLGCLLGHAVLCNHGHVLQLSALEEAVSDGAASVAVVFAGGANGGPL